MANRVEFSIPKREIGNADIKVEVRQDGSKGKLGTLLISRGDLEWRVFKGRGGKKTTYKVKWDKVGEMMMKEAAATKK
jgi:hypothetical protein